VDPPLSRVIDLLYSLSPTSDAGTEQSSTRSVTSSVVFGFSQHSSLNNSPTAVVSLGCSALSQTSFNCFVLRVDILSYSRLTHLRSHPRRSMPASGATGVRVGTARP